MWVEPLSTVQKIPFFQERLMSLIPFKNNLSLITLDFQNLRQIILGLDSIFHGDTSEFYKLQEKKSKPGSDLPKSTQTITVG